MNKDSQEGRAVNSSLKLIDLRKYDIVHAHFLLGQEVRNQVHTILQRKLSVLTPQKLKSEIDLAKKCRSDIEEKIHRQRDRAVSAALERYWNCLNAWANGAELEAVNHPNLEGVAFTPADLGLLLQMENDGCQIGAYRMADGGIVIWHTEEEMDHARFDKLRIASFNISLGTKTWEVFSFIYPDLLPGPAFGWVHDSRSVFVQAVASLPIKPNLQYSIIANIATWIILFWGNEIDSKTIISELGPFIDGYALITASKDKHVINASRVEFGHELIIAQSLDRLPGSLIYQTNAFSNSSERAFRKINTIQPRYSYLYHQREVRNSKAVSKLEKNITEDVLSSFYDLICSETGKDFAYANLDVMGYFLCYISSSSTQIKVGSGPAHHDKNYKLLSFAY